MVKLRVVDDYRCKLGIDDGDFRHTVFWHPHRYRCAARHSTHTGDESLACVLVVAAHVQFEFHFLGDDIALGAAVDGANRKHCRFLRRGAAAHDGLQLHNDARG